MKATYIYSFYTITKQTDIQHPRWWEFWKKSKLVENTYWCRKYTNIDLSDNEFKTFEKENVV